jgi:hypothetical protein
MRTPAPSGTNLSCSLSPSYPGYLLLTPPSLPFLTPGAASLPTSPATGPLGTEDLLIATLPQHGHQLSTNTNQLDQGRNL